MIFLNASRNFLVDVKSIIIIIDFMKLENLRYFTRDHTHMILVETFLMMKDDASQ